MPVIIFQNKKLKGAAKIYAIKILNLLNNYRNSKNGAGRED